VAQSRAPLKPLDQRRRPSGRPAAHYSRRAHAGRHEGGRRLQPPRRLWATARTSWMSIGSRLH